LHILKLVLIIPFFQIASSDVYNSACNQKRSIKSPHAWFTVRALGSYFLHPHPFLAVLAGFFAAGFFAFPFAVAMVILLCMV